MRTFVTAAWASVALAAFAFSTAAFADDPAKNTGAAIDQTHVALLAISVQPTSSGFM